MKTLIVDDSPWARNAIMDALRDVGGCDIVGEAANGLQALELARVSLPNLVIMDIRMPLMGGLDTLKLLKSEWADTQVVLVSTMVEPETREIALSLGALACLEKGAGLRNQLRALVSQLTQTASTSDQGREE